MTDENPQDQPTSPTTHSEEPQTGRRSWEDYVDPPASAHLQADGSDGSGWCRLGIVCALLGIFLPLVFGPTAFTFGLLARDKNNPRAAVPIILGVLVTIYGVVYYRLVVSGSLM